MAKVLDLPRLTSGQQLALTGAIGLALALATYGAVGSHTTISTKAAVGWLRQLARLLTIGTVAANISAGWSNPIAVGRIRILGATPHPMPRP
jgi:hypothetical protein